MAENEGIMDKITDLLSDEESVRQLTELAQMLASGDLSEEGESGTPQTGMPDLSAIMKLSGMAGALKGNDRNTELLMALKPRLSEERQGRVDKAVKLLKILALWNLAKESGLLNELL